MIEFAVPAPERRDTLRLADGRALAWCEWGDPRGAVVLFCTGAGMAGRLGFGTEALRRQGLRLIAPARPGLGASDPDPDKTLQSVAQDFGRLLDRIGASAAAGVVAFSQGAPFALALAQARPVAALALVSAQDELAFPAMRAQLSPPISDLVDLAAMDVDALAAELAPMSSADGLFNLVVGTASEHDRAVYADRTFAAAYRADLEEGFTQGPGGYAHDVAIALAPWNLDMARIAPPVRLWYGARDASPVHSPDFGATLATRLPRVQRRVLDDEGGSLLWTRADAILSDLRAQMGGRA
jgi:pimeloyl-ACP methyl ester carboxylesterase